MKRSLLGALCVLSVLLLLAFGLLTVRSSSSSTGSSTTQLGSTSAPHGGTDGAHWADKVLSRQEEGRAPHDVDFCCCSGHEVEAQSATLLSLLNRIVRRPFFRFLKVNVHKPCPYYAVSLLCQSAYAPCTVCKCDAEQVPLSLRTDSDMSELPEDYTDAPLAGKSAVPSSVSNWGGDVFEGLMDEHEHDTAGSEYVDLVLNPEGHTGYFGPGANRIWEGIYRDNCVFDGPQCKEQRVFYKLLSGLHTSISTHIALTWNAFIPDGSPKGTNCTELKNRVLAFPDHVENLHMLYQFVLRAMTRAAGAFLNDPAMFQTEDAVQDAELAADLKSLFQVDLLCSNTFNETLLLGNSNHRSLLHQFRKQMKNITTLTDCIPCEKCRVWGKLQFLGVATALRVVTQPPDAKVSLARNEMVAMVNLLRQLTVSVEGVRTQCQAPPSAPPPDSTIRTGEL